MRRLVSSALLAFVLSVPFIAKATPGANQLLSWGDLCGEQAAGRFAWSNGTPSQCSSLPKRIISWADFVGSVRSNGCGSGNPLPTYQSLLNCRVLVGLVSAAVSGSADGPVPCNQTCLQGGGSPTPAAPLDTSTSSTTANPTNSTPISWNVTPSSLSGTCTLSLYQGTTRVAGPFTLTASTATSGQYTTSSGGGVYKLEAACSSNSSFASFTGSGNTLSWYQ